MGPKPANYNPPTTRSQVILAIPLMGELARSPKFFDVLQSRVTVALRRSRGEKIRLMLCRLLLRYHFYDGRYALVRCPEKKQWKAINSAKQVRILQSWLRDVVRSSILFRLRGIMRAAAWIDSCFKCRRDEIWSPRASKMSRCAILDSLLIFTPNIMRMNYYVAAPLIDSKS